MNDNDKVISITATSDTLFGLTEEGKLAVYDKDASAWVQRCDASVLDATKASILKRAEPVIAPTRYRVPEVEKEVEEKEDFVYQAMLWSLVSMIIVAAIIGIYFLSR